MLKKPELKKLLRMFKDTHYSNPNNMTKTELNELYNNYLEQMVDKVISSKKTKKNILRGSALMDSMIRKKKGDSIFSKIQNWLSSIKKKLFFPSDRLQKDSQEVFNEYKNEEIFSLEVRRVPLSSGFQIFANAISFGALKKKISDLGYDNVFHLSLMVVFKNREVITIEKNEAIRIAKGYTYDESEGMEFMAVPFDEINNKLTLNELLEKTRKRIGDHYFYQYNLKDNNCQKFIINILKSNDLLTPELKEFIEQDVLELFKSLPSFADKFAQFATDSYAKIKEFLGQGRNLNLYPYVKDAGYSICYDKSNGNFKFRFKGKSKGTSTKMPNTQGNKNLACFQLMEKEGITF